MHSGGQLVARLKRLSAGLGLILVACGVRPEPDPNQSVLIGVDGAPQVALETLVAPDAPRETIRGLDELPVASDQRSVFGLSRRNWPETVFVVPQGDTRHDATYTEVRAMTREIGVRGGRFPTVDSADALPDPRRQRELQVEGLLAPVLAVYDGVMLVPRAVLERPGQWASTTPLRGRVPDERETVEAFRTGDRSRVVAPAWALPVVVPSSSAGVGKPVERPVGPPKRGPRPQFRFPDRPEGEEGTGGEKPAGG
jgi:hypothetical protein